MVAKDHLNAYQFATMDQLKSAGTPEAREHLGQRTVGDMLSKKRGDMARDPGTYDLLRSNMRKQGQTVPIHMAEGQIMNGLHRIAIADELGWPGLHYSPNYMDTEDNKWNKLTGHMP